MTKTLDELLQNSPFLWRGADVNKRKTKGISTGHSDLDEILPANGWPSYGLIEVVASHWGIGELHLVLPALAQLSQQSRRIVWIAPPFVPYAPELFNKGVAIEQITVIPAQKISTSTMWTMEKILKTQRCGIVMSWSNRIQDKTIRRLQLAAEAGNSLGFLFRTVEVHASAAVIRIRIKTVSEGLEVEVLKARGGGRFKRICISYT